MRCLPLNSEEQLNAQTQALDDAYEADVIEMIDEDGHSTQFEIIDYFFYNGEEFAILTEYDASKAEQVAQCAPDDETDEQEEVSCYIMKVVASTDDAGEEIEEFVPVEDQALEAKLIEIASTRLNADDDLDDEG